MPSDRRLTDGAPEAAVLAPVLVPRTTGAILKGLLSTVEVTGALTRRELDAIKVIADQLPEEWRDA